MAYVPFEEFGIMRNLRTVGIAKTRGKIMNMQGMSYSIYKNMRVFQFYSFIKRKISFSPYPQSIYFRAIERARFEWVKRSKAHYLSRVCSWS